MDSTNDLIVSVATASKICTVNWATIEPYAVSLHRSGFNGTKIMFVSGIDSDTVSKLIATGIQVIEFTKEQNFIWPPIVKFLFETKQEFRNILYVDCFDVVFQSNPSTWLEQNLGEHRLVGCTDSVTIENGGGTDIWVKDFNPEAYEKIKHEDVCCCVTVMGEAHAMRDLLTEINTEINTALCANRRLVDQGILNALLYTKYKDITMVPKLAAGFVGGVVQFLGGNTTVWTNPHPRLDMETGLVYPAGSNTPFVIVHQHNRNQEWWTRISLRYVKTAPSMISVATTEIRNGVSASRVPRYVNRGCLVQDWWDRHKR